MAKNALTRKVLDIVGGDPSSFDEAKESKVKDLLRPINHEMDIKDVKKWQTCKGNW